MRDSNEKWLAVVNVHAGSGRTAHLWKKAESLLHELGVDYDSRMTLHEGHATELAFNGAQRGIRSFIAVGGDGTIHEVLGGIMSYVEAVGDTLSDYALAVIPIGSGNDWIRSHNIPLDVETAVRLLSRGSFVMQDVFKATILPQSDSAFADKADSGRAGYVGEADKKGYSGEAGYVGEAEKKEYIGEAEDGKYRKSEVSYMANVGGVGYDSRVCETVNRWKSKGRHGSLLYIKSLICNFFHYSHMNVEIECDGELTFSGETYSIAFGNGRYSGGGIAQTPEAVFNDGLLEVTIIPRYSRLRILREIPKLFAGRILSVKGIIARKARSVIVRPIGTDREKVEIDGEIVGPVPVLIALCPGRLRVLHQEM